MNKKETEFEGVKQIKLPQQSVKQQTFVNPIMNFRCYGTKDTVGNFGFKSTNLVRRMEACNSKPTWL